MFLGNKCGVATCSVCQKRRNPHLTSLDLTMPGKGSRWTSCEDQVLVGVILGLEGRTSWERVNAACEAQGLLRHLTAPQAYSHKVNRDLALKTHWETVGRSIHAREARAARLQERAGQQGSPGHTAAAPSPEVRGANYRPSPEVMAGGNNLLQQDWRHHIPPASTGRSYNLTTLPSSMLQQADQPLSVPGHAIAVCQPLHQLQEWLPAQAAGGYAGISAGAHLNINIMRQPAQAALPASVDDQHDFFKRSRLPTVRSEIPGSASETDGSSPAGSPPSRDVDMMELPAQLPSSLHYQRLDNLIDWTCEVPDAVMAALNYPGVGQPNAMDLDVALKAQQGWPQILSGHLPTVHSLGCQQGVSWKAGSRICIGGGTASQSAHLDRHLGQKARGFSAHLQDTLGQKGAFYFACLAVALPQALSMEQCMTAVKDARACFGRSYAVSVQAQTLKFSLQPGQDEPVSLETIAEPPKVLAAVWARADLIKLVVSAMHTGSRVLVHVEGLHRAIPCRVEHVVAGSKAIVYAKLPAGLPDTSCLVELLHNGWSSLPQPVFTDRMLYEQDSPIAAQQAEVISVIQELCAEEQLKLRRNKKEFGGEDMEVALSLLELSRSQPSEGSGHSQVEVSPRRPIRPRTTPQPQHPQLQSSNSLHGVTHPDHQLRTPGGINDWPACPIPRSASAQHAPPRSIPPPSDSALRRHPACCKRSRSDTLAFSLPDHRQEGTAVPSPHAPAPPPAAKQEAGHGNPMWGAVMQLLQTQLDFPARQDALGALLGLQTEAQQETATTTSLVAALQAMGKGRLAAPHQQLPAMAAVDCAAARLPGSHPSSLYRPPQTMHPAVEDDAHAELKVALRKMEQQPVHIAAQIAQEAISLQRLRAEAACSAAARDSGRLCNAAQHSMASSQPAAAKAEPTFTPAGPSTPGLGPFIFQGPIKEHVSLGAAHTSAADSRLPWPRLLPYPSLGSVSGLPQQDAIIPMET